MGGSSYEELPLGEIADFRNGKGLSPEKYTPMGRHPVFGSNGQIARTDELLNEDPVVVIGRVGAYCGSVHLVFEQSWVTDNAIVARPKPGEDVRYLYYRLQSLDLRSTATGSAQPLVTQGGLSALRAPHAPPHKQHAIARILGALDDKIELNRKMNETLEAMARALFKSWFVDFDPVRAKAQGRPPSGMDTETAKLFPNKLVDSELGPIPHGWRIGDIGDVASSRRDTVHPKDLQVGGVYVGLEHLPRGRVFFDDTSTTDDLESLKARFSQGEVLFGKLRPYFKKVAIAPCEGICSTDILVLTPRRNTTAFVVLLAASEPLIEHAVALSDGTRMPRTSWEQLTRFDIVIPPDVVLHAFDRQNIAKFRRAEANRQECLTLARLRDTLLPRLLSGELSVAAAERAVEQVA